MKHDISLTAPTAETTGTLTALPAILYSRPSFNPVAAALSNCSSAKPCKRQHSLGVSVRTPVSYTHLPLLPRTRYSFVISVRLAFIAIIAARARCV